MSDTWCNANSATPASDTSGNTWSFASDEMCAGLSDADADNLTDTYVGPCADLGAPLICGTYGHAYITGVDNTCDWIIAGGETLIEPPSGDEYDDDGSSDDDTQEEESNKRGRNDENEDDSDVNGPKKRRHE